MSLREQLITQIILGVLCGDLGPGQRLPSTRELARRYRIHANTVSAGYRQLEKERWVEFRRGSGVYVRGAKPDTPISAGLALDQMVASLFRSARALGAPLAQVRARLGHWLSLQPPDHFLLIEPDEELRKIAAAEMRQAASLPVQTCAVNDPGLAQKLDGAIAVALPSKEKAARQVLPHGCELLVLRVRSVPSSLAGWLPAPAEALVGVVSRWPDFLRLGRTMLIAAGFSPESLLLRDARKSNWRRGLKDTAAVVCDSLTVAELPKGLRAVVFPLLAESSLAELRRYEAFVRGPLAPSL
ncbi:MAG: GntR family transcriptional regulator [Acidobacteriia bacterium]|nr:GntR family transcriptional regulator [Terriglobia bacterium]